jgi:hypothetical protein
MASLKTSFSRTAFSLFTDVVGWLDVLHRFNADMGGTISRIRILEDSDQSGESLLNLPLHEEYTFRYQTTESTSGSTASLLSTQSFDGDDDDVDDRRSCAWSGCFRCLF